MSFFALFLTAIGLSMDAFAVAICKGLSVPKTTVRQMLCAGLYFGGFQSLMPLLGWLCGAQFEKYITRYDHWIAFVLLVVIGGNMVRESFDRSVEKTDPSFGVKAMLPLAVATSIDALAVGVSFAFLQVDIVPAVLFIGGITFAFSAVGVRIGNVFGAAYKSRAELVGGVILILMGTKILLEHLGIL